MNRSRLLLDIVEEVDMETHFNTRTNKHISLVKKYLDKIIALKDPRLDRGVLEQEKSHDASKFKDPEYEPYLHIDHKYNMKSQGKTYNPPKEIADKMSLASFHHVTSNQHHPEAWDKEIKQGSNNRDENIGTVDATSMPLNYVASMVADWMAMSKELGNSPYDWAKKNIGSKYKFTDVQKKLIYDLLDKVWSKEGKQ